MSYEKKPDNNEQIDGKFFGVLNLKLSIKSSNIFLGSPLIFFFLFKLSIL